MSSSPATGRRDRNREALYRAALDLFAERGYRATTMDDVAVRAGLARRSAFNHFPTKSDLTVEWTARRRAAALATVGDEGGHVDAVARLRAWFHALGELSEARPEETEQMTLGWLEAGGPARHRTGTADAVAPWLREGIRDGSIDRAVDPGIAAELLLDAYLGALYRWFGVPADRRTPLPAQVDTVVGLVLSGLAPR